MDAATLRAAITPSDVAAGGTASVAVFNPPPGGGVSDSLTVSVVNPAPSITAVSPTDVTAGIAGLTLTVEGTNFVRPSVVRWNGPTGRRPTWITGRSGQRSARAMWRPEAPRRSRCSPAHRVGGVTSDLTISMVNPLPSLTALSSGTAIAGRDQFTFTLVGTGFLASSVARWNGADRTTTYVARDTLQAVILASDVATGDTASITVFTPPTRWRRL